MQIDEREWRRYNTLLCKSQKGRIPHWEAWSHPDAESFLTGIDYYEHPRLCRQRMRELFPELGLYVFPDDTPRSRPAVGGETVNIDAATVRWGDSESATWVHGEQFFKTEEDVLSFRPLEHADMRDWVHVVANYDYRTEDGLYRNFRKDFPKEWDAAVPGRAVNTGTYNTMFMWPLLTFGWDLFLRTCLEDDFGTVMDGFAELNRRAFHAMCRLPVNFIVCHDDIATARGPVCSREWMYKYIYPRYEEFFSMAKEAGKTILFMADGCLDDQIDDVIACGARGLISEPVTDYRKILKKHPDFFVAGEGDNRILSYGNPDDIRRMVEKMVDTSKLGGGYMMSIGNHIPWNVPVEAVGRYLDLCGELAYR